MATIIIADDTSRYDGSTLDRRPLGGTESSVIRLSEALAARGHNVRAFTNCDRQIEHNGVTWLPLGSPAPESADIFMPVQHPRLFGLVRRPKQRFVWLTWRPNNLKHHKNIAKVWWYRPFPIFMSEHQAAIYPRLAPQPREKIVIPLGLPEQVRGAGPLSSPPRPRAIFASNPARGLGELLDLWSRRIRPAVPGAELHVYGMRSYDHSYDAPWQEPERVHRLGAAYEKDGVVLQPPATPLDLAAAMRASRVMLYPGHRSEMFCLAVAEAQALGVPAVLGPVAVLPERIIDGVTGFLRADETGFAEAAIRLLTDDALWTRQHRAALDLGQGLSWPEVAARFESVFDLAS